MKDIDICAEAIKPARQGRIHTFIGTSPLHRKYQMSIDEAEVLSRVTASVTRARSYTDNVEWSAMDATRTEADFLCACVEAAIKAGATTVNIPDTVGYATPDEFAALMRMIIKRVPNSDKAVFSTHCHNDLGLAVANSLAGVGAGARQVECALNGLGERAGNAALEEVVVLLSVRQATLGVKTNVRLEMLYATSRMLTEITGAQVAPNKAVVGANAFAHEAGIHQDGILKNPLTYEIISPEAVGVPKRQLVLGKHSGRNALRATLVDLGYQPSREELDECYKRVVALADASKQVTNRDVLAIAHQVMRKRGSETAMAT
jgi:2-isopropylmalate synthase